MVFRTAASGSLMKRAVRAVRKSMETRQESPLPAKSFSATTLAERRATAAMPAAGRRRPRERRSDSRRGSRRSLKPRRAGGMQRRQHRGAAHDAQRAREQGQAAGDAAVAHRQRRRHDVGVGHGEQAVAHAFEHQQQRHQRHGRVDPGEGRAAAGRARPRRCRRRPSAAGRSARTSQADKRRTGQAADEGQRQHHAARQRPTASAHSPGSTA